MKPMQAHLLTQQVLMLCKQNDYAINTHSYKNGKLSSDGHTLDQEIDYILSLGLNPLAAYEDTNNGKINILIISILESSIHEDLKIKFLEKITPENLNDLPKELQNELVEKFLSDGPNKCLNYLFKNGYRIIQGNSENALEINMATNGYIDFFEVLSEYQPEFEWNRKYDAYQTQQTIIEIIQEEMTYPNLPKSYMVNLERTLLFINNLLKIKQYQQLNEDLPEADIKARMKL